MPWYKTGRVAITAGQTTVTGTGTDFAANARAGDGFAGPDGRWYEVVNVASPTVLSILPAYQGATIASGTYAVVPVQGYSKTLADAVNQVVQQWGSTLAGLGEVASENIVPVIKGGTGATTKETARAALGALGVGEYGFGSYASRWTGANADSASVVASGFYDIVPSTSSPWANSPFPGEWTRLINISHNNAAGYWTQLAFSFNTNPKVKVRGMSGGELGTWSEILTTNNGVTLDTAQEITAQKTFTGVQIRHRSATPGLWMSPTDGVSDEIWMVLSGNVMQWQRRANGFTNTLRTPTPMYMELNNNTVAFGYQPRPSSDNTLQLGASNARWSTIYAGSGTINTSDAREKTPVSGLTGQEIAAAKALSKEIGTYKWLQAVQDKGADARAHVGLTVQRAIEIMQANGLEPFEYGFICYDKWEATEDVVQTTRLGRVYIPATEGSEEVELYADVEESMASDEGSVWEFTHEISEVTVPGSPAGDRYSFRYDELNLFIAAGIEARLAALEDAVG